MKQIKAKYLKANDIFCKEMRVTNRKSYKVLIPLSDNTLIVENRNTGEQEEMIINKEKYVIHLRTE